MKTKKVFKIKYPIPKDCKDCYFKDKKAKFMPCCTYPSKLEWNENSECLSKRKMDITNGEGSNTQQP
jgi:hypothetical protein